MEIRYNKSIRFQTAQYMSGTVYCLSKCIFYKCLKRADLTLYENRFSLNKPTTSFSTSTSYLWPTTTLQIRRSCRSNQIVCNRPSSHWRKSMKD